jgi:hypothetical protein
VKQKDGTLCRQNTCLPPDLVFLPRYLDLPACSQLVVPRFTEGKLFVADFSIDKDKEIYKNDCDLLLKKKPGLKGSDPNDVYIACDRWITNDAKCDWCTGDLFIACTKCNANLCFEHTECPCKDERDFVSEQQFADFQSTWKRLGEHDPIFVPQKGKRVKAELPMIMKYRVEHIANYPQPSTCLYQPCCHADGADQYVQCNHCEAEIISPALNWPYHNMCVHCGWVYPRPHAAAVEPGVGPNHNHSHVEVQCDLGEGNVFSGLVNLPRGVQPVLGQELTDDDAEKFMNEPLTVGHTFHRLVNGRWVRIRVGGTGAVGVPGSPYEPRQIIHSVIVTPNLVSTNRELTAFLQIEAMYQPRESKLLAVLKQKSVSWLRKRNTNDLTAEEELLLIARAVTVAMVPDDEEQRTILQLGTSSVNKRINEASRAFHKGDLPKNGNCIERIFTKQRSLYSKSENC